MHGRPLPRGALYFERSAVQPDDLVAQSEPYAAAARL
jgi:hypothetical protein